LSEEQPLIIAKNLQKSYGKTPVLTDVTFDIQPGVTGILGSNGAGKTTVLGMILGLHHRDGGELKVLGSDPWHAGAKVRERIGYAPEHHTLSPDLRASDFVQHVAELHGLPTHEAVGRASDALWLVGLGEERFRPMGTMSTGQRQRVKIAQAIAHDPKIIMLDEPTDGLDPDQRENVLELISNISSEFNINVVLSSHLIEEVEKICDAVVIIGDGKTLKSGSINHLKNQTEEQILVELKADQNQIQSIIKSLESSSSVKTVNSDQTKLAIQINDDKAFDALRDACIENNAGIVRLNKKRLSLEEVFIGSIG